VKYWKDTDVEHIDYVEGSRTLPHGKPASIAISDTTRIETEIIPNTTQIRKYVDANTFNMVEGMCVDVERRIWRDERPMHCEVIFVPLLAVGYDEEPMSYTNFEHAMEIV